MKILKPIETPYCIIPELFLFEGEGACYILNRKSGTGMMINSALSHTLEIGNPSESFLGKLISRGMTDTAVPDDTDVTGINFFLIDMTGNCNFACKYCLRDPDIRSGRISLKMLDSILEKITEYCRKHEEHYITIQPWGGEPLLEADKIIHIREKMNEIAPDILVNISIETNGSLITAELAKKLKQANISIGISIDGPKQIHNKNRVSLHGSPTYEEVCSGIRIMHDTGQDRIGSISVITKRHINSIPEILNFFAKNFPGMSLKLNPIHSPGDSEEISDSLGGEDMPRFTRILAVSVIGLAREGIVVKEANVITALRNLLYRDPDNICKSRGCQGGRKMIIFDRQGDYYPCEMVNYPGEKLGNISDGRDLGDAVDAAAACNFYFKEKHKPECDTCPWWYFCRGGCTSAMMYSNKEGVTVDEAGCAGTKTLYEILMELITDDPELAITITGNRQIRDVRKKSEQQ